MKWRHFSLLTFSLTSNKLFYLQHLKGLKYKAEGSAHQPPMSHHHKKDVENSKGLPGRPAHLQGASRMGSWEAAGATILWLPPAHGALRWNHILHSVTVVIVSQPGVTLAAFHLPLQEISETQRWGSCILGILPLYTESLEHSLHGNAPLRNSWVISLIHLEMTNGLHQD